MWQLKTKAIPEVIGALGMVRKGIQKCIDEIPGELYLQDIQKIVLINTAQILDKYATCETKVASKIRYSFECESDYKYISY